jgi:hypothetical protein
MEGAAVGVCAAEGECDVNEEAEEVVDLLESLEGILLVLLWELEKVLFIDDTKLALTAKLAVVCNGTVVGPLTMTSVIPEITVVNPEIEKAELTGIVAEPVMTTSVVPPMTVREPGKEVCLPG